MSRAIPEKGWREAIEAVTRARELSRRDIHLVLVGDGPVLTALRREGTPAFVHPVGFQPDTRAYYAMGDMGLLPSRFAGESFPLVLIECLQAGRPMMATALGEIPRMLDAGDGGLRARPATWRHGASTSRPWPPSSRASPPTPRPTPRRSRCVPEAARKFDPRIMREAYSHTLPPSPAQRLAS